MVTDEQELEQQISDLEIGATALEYYLYRQEGCPNGETLDGFIKWRENCVIKPFQAIATELNSDSE